MDDRAQLVPAHKLAALLALIDKEEKIDKEAVQMLSQFTEKFVNDIIGRASLITKHKNEQVISEADVKFVLETEFNYFISTNKSNK